MKAAMTLKIDMEIGSTPQFQKSYAPQVLARPAVCFSPIPGAGVVNETRLRRGQENATFATRRTELAPRSLAFSQTNAERVHPKTMSGDESFEWFSQAVNTVAGFRSLQLGWDGYSAEPPKEIATYYAREFLFALSSSIGMKPTRVAPSSVGGVGISIKRNRRKAYVEFYNDGLTHVLFAGKDPEPIAKAVRPENNGFRDLVSEIRHYLDA
ncbi:MAG TPA: hypothetical protein VFW23_16070 [Tepidisphaeraceae bacterium]|nr:hypothetical protein [Tepidisphaeraceae bacterium]